MIIELRNKKEVFLRTLVSTDAEKLYQYLTHLSSESLSRFGPHAFDKEAINNICSSLAPATKRYIAIDTTSDNIAAYMLIQQGMIEWGKLFSQRSGIYEVEARISSALMLAVWASLCPPLEV